VRCHWEHPWGAHSELQEHRGEHLEMLGTSLKIDGNILGTSLKIDGNILGTSLKIDGNRLGT